MIHRYMNYLRQSSLFKYFEDLEIETFLNGVEHRFIEVKANNKYEPRNSRYVIVLSGLLTVCVTNIKGRKDTIQGFYPIYNEFLSFDVSDYNNKIRTGFYVRLALSLIHGGSEEYCKESLSKALNISKEKTMEYIDQLYCEPEYKARMKELIS